MFKRDDVFCLDDLEFFHLKRVDSFGYSDVYSNGDYTVLLDKVSGERELYNVVFFYKNNEVKK